MGGGGGGGGGAGLIMKVYSTILKGGTLLRKIDLSRKTPSNGE